MIKLLHCGDIHLDSPFSLLEPEEGLRRRDELRRTFIEMLAYARHEGVQVVLIAGDLFDHGFATAETVKLLADATASMEEIRFVIAPGNHDAAIAGSAYLGDTFPPNVTVFRRDTLAYVDFDDLDLRVWGYGFTSDRLEGSPIAGQDLAVAGKTAVLCAHADLGAPLSKYAPMSGNDLAASNLAYAALGHVHRAGELQTFGQTQAAYSGCLVGRSYDECGIGGAILLEVEDNRVLSWQRIPFAHRQYAIEHLNVDGASGDGDIIDAIKTAMAAWSYGEETALRIYLEGAIEPTYTPDLAAISAACRGELWQMELKDSTLPIWCGDYLERDPGIRGALYRTLLPKMQSGTPEERTRAVAALRLGLSALEGKL